MAGGKRSPALGRVEMVGGIVAAVPGHDGEVVEGGGALPLPRAALRVRRASQPHRRARRGVARAPKPLPEAVEIPGESSPRLRSASLSLPGDSQGVTRASQASTRAAPRAPGDARRLRMAAPRTRGASVRAPSSGAADIVRRSLDGLVLSPFSSSGSVQGRSSGRPPRKGSLPGRSSSLPARSSSLPLWSPAPPFLRFSRFPMGRKPRPRFSARPGEHRAPPHPLFAQLSPVPGPLSVLMEMLSLCTERRGVLPALARENAGRLAARRERFSKPTKSGILVGRVLPLVGGTANGANDWPRGGANGQSWT